MCIRDRLYSTARKHLCQLSTLRWKHWLLTRWSIATTGQRDVYKRQVLAVGVAVGIYFAMQPYVGTEEIGWMCILGAVPFAEMCVIDSSIIETPESLRGKRQYEKWRAEKNNQPTWRTAIRQDVDLSLIHI